MKDNDAHTMRPSVPMTLQIHCHRHEWRTARHIIVGNHSQLARDAYANKLTRQIISIKQTPAYDHGPELQHFSSHVDVILREVEFEHHFAPINMQQACQCLDSQQLYASMARVYKINQGHTYLWHQGG